MVKFIEIEVLEWHSHTYASSWQPSTSDDAAAATTTKMYAWYEMKFARAQESTHSVTNNKRQIYVWEFVWHAQQNIFLWLIGQSRTRWKHCITDLLNRFFLILCVCVRFRAQDYRALFCSLLFWLFVLSILIFELSSCGKNSVTLIFIHDDRDKEKQLTSWAAGFKFQLGGMKPKRPSNWLAATFQGKSFDKGKQPGCIDNTFLNTFENKTNDKQIGWRVVDWNLNVLSLDRTNI